MARVDSENTTGMPAGDDDGSLYLPTDVSPEDLFQAIGKLRMEAIAEIDRLIGFLDKTDDYLSRELEDDGDQADASYPETGSRICAPIEDDEEAGDENEPSLGSTGQYNAGDQTMWDRGSSSDCEGDEHDGAEPDDECDGRPDDEPSLGWTVDGCIQNTGVTACDAELQDHARVMPQDRTDLGAGVTAETSYRRFVCGLTPQQERAFREAMRAGKTSGVLIR